MFQTQKKNLKLFELECAIASKIKFFLKLCSKSSRNDYIVQNSKMLCHPKLNARIKVQNSRQVVFRGIWCKVPWYMKHAKKFWYKCSEMPDLNLRQMVKAS